MNQRQFIWVMLLCVYSATYAQRSITLDEATIMAMQNNGMLKSLELNSLYKQQLTKTAMTLPSTSFQLEAGQLNSAYLDNKVGVSQSFYTRGAIKSQKGLLLQEYELARSQKVVAEYEVRTMVRTAFIQLLYLNEKEKQLLSTYRLYDSFLVKAQLRLKAGESNLLEVTTAQSQQEQISLQLLQLKTDKNLSQQQLQLALKTQEIVVPMGNLYEWADYKTDTLLIPQHPLLLELEQQHQVAIATTEVEKSRLLPEFNAGLNTMTIRGTGADNKLYNAAQRFQWVQAGIAIPIFKNAQKEKIKAAKMYEGVIASQYNQQRLTVLTAYQQAIDHYHAAIQAVQYYQSTGLSRAAAIKATVGKQFSNGEINYLEWVMLIGQAITIENNYLESVKSLQDAQTRLLYFKQN